ncbi:ATPase component of ABC transporter [Labilithrix luteola]|uniref:Probable ATP-binding protein YbiT n=1 Tax=Labilithrix luteola TaxID=1391654 RepID=A0A0K1Q0E9_9BACT|nr:ABC-F family ATP-binding cassette domain-containing protein [Labilithrix luteola]AKU98889.1 ATPase component of ABC transporter [Labilithrix luteola]
MIGTTQLGKSFGGRTLFEDVSLQLNPGSRYGLVGANGSGKTTFLKIVAGDEPSTEGTVAIPGRARVGVLRQDLFLDDDQIILDLAMMGDAEAWRLLEERSRIVDHGEGDAAHLADIELALQNADGYTLESRAAAILVGLGIPLAQHKLPLSTLSGGFKLRVLLARVLLGGPDVLLLDEPTNHLDILSIRWLEKFLAGYRGTALVISHDQRFLDNVATHILDVDYGTVTPYTGNYSAFVIEKKAVRERKESEIARQEKIIAEKRAFVERFGAKATKAKQAQSRLKQIEKIEVEELAQSSRRAPLFRFTPERPSGRDVIEIGEVSKAYGEKQVLKNVSLTVRRGEKVAIIGPNGLGKSTLLKILMGRLESDNGAVKFGHEVKPGYFAQDHHELLLDPKGTPLDFVWNAVPMEATSYVRGQLGRMLFSGDEVEKPIGALSGGEAARLVFARIIIEKPNLLVLDEPTNHLDLESIDSLAEGLRTFDGTVLFVSHDRWFVSQLATRVIEITPNGVRDFPGTYAEYLERCGDDHLDADTVVLKAKSEKSADGAGKDGKTDGATSALSWEEQKKRRNRLAALPQKRDKVLAAVEEAEARKKAIHEMYATDGFFEKTSKDEQARLEKESADLDGKIETLMAEWEALEAEIAAGEA